MARTRVLDEAGRRPGPGTAAAAVVLADRLPHILLEARRVSASLAPGLHGRRRAGPGETFWQFRPFVNGEAAGRIDWRRSGRDDRLFVREREWETPHAAWLWIDRSTSMAFASDLAGAPKIERALVLGLALAEALVSGGERVGLIGLRPPAASRNIAERLVETLLGSPAEADDLPPARPLGRQDEAIVIGDLLAPPADFAARIDAIAARGARGHCCMIVDPVEETFPFDGQAVLTEGETGLKLRIGDAATWGRDYRARIARHRASLADALRRHGWTFTIHHTDRPATEAALRLLTLISASRGREAAA